MVYGIRKVSSRLNRSPKIIKTRQRKHNDPQKFRDVAYRPPKYESETLVEMETLLKALENEKKEIILIGDLNCNDLPADKNGSSEN